MDKKIKISKSLFENILSVTTHKELEDLLHDKGFTVTSTFDVTTVKVEKLIFDDRFVFDFSSIEFINISFNLEIENDIYLEYLKIENNHIDKYKYFKFKNISIKDLIVINNSNIDLEFQKSKIQNLNYDNNKSCRRIYLNNTEVTEELKINKSEIKYLYFEDSTFYDVDIDQTIIDFEGIVFKKSNFKDIIISQNSSISSISFIESQSSIFSGYESKINYLSIEKSDIKYLNLTTIDKLDEFKIYDSSKIDELNIYKSSLNRFLINKNVIIDKILIQKKATINSILITDECKIYEISLNESKVSNFKFYRGISINYVQSDKDSKLGNFDILESSIKSLILIDQINSYTFQNTEIGFLKLDNCKISSLNLRNGCKIEAYITNCDINKIDFKQIIVLKDTSISFSACKVYSIIMENFSVIGNLYFRELQPLSELLTEEWSDLDKYETFPPLFENEEYKEEFILKSHIINKIKNNPKNWAYTKEIDDSDDINKTLNSRNYIDSRLTSDDVDEIINILKEAFLSDKVSYEKNLYGIIKSHIYNNFKQLRNFTSEDRNNLNFNFKIIRFIWDVIEKLHTHDLIYQNINKPLFRVYQSSLGKTEFSNCLLKDFELQYNSTNFYDCLFLGTDIPEDKLKILDGKIDIVNVKDKSVNKKDFYKQKSEFYNQFKKIFEKQGNIFNAGIYNSKWAENQEKLLLLEINKKEHFLNSKIAFISFLKSISLFFEKENIEIKQDIFTFNLNRISNNHGESWIKTIWFILVPLFILYLLFITSIYYDFFNPFELWDKNSSFTFDYEIFGLFKYHIKDFFSFLNPTRRLDFFKPIEKLGYIDSLGYFLDFMARIILAFGIYQLIVAFRKNAKKH